MEIAGFLARWDTRTGKGKRDKGIVAKGVLYGPGGAVLARQTDKWIVLVRGWGSSDITCAGHAQGPRAMAFSPDGQRFATCEKEIKIWDVSDGREVLSLDDFGDQAAALTFAPDGHCLRAVGFNGTVRTWLANPRPEPPVISNPSLNAVALEILGAGICILFVILLSLFFAVRRVRARRRKSY